MELNKIIQGDCLEVMKTLPENSVDSICTDPPYELGFMGKSWDSTGIANNKEMWAEALRVLKPGGHLLSFGGTRTYHRMACAIEDAGFEVRDMISWIYGSGFPKSRNIGKDMEKLSVGGIKNLKQIGTKKGIKVETGTQGYSYSKEYVPGVSMGGKQISGDIPVYEINNDFGGWGTALKPACEPCVLARKPLSEKTVALNVLKWGTGGINIDESRVEAPNEDTGRKNISDVKDTDTVGNWGMKAHDSSGRIGEGRFPANIIHDGSDEVLEVFPNTKSGGGLTKRKNKDAMFDFGQGYEREEISDSGSASRFFKTCSPTLEEQASRFVYCPKTSKSERNRGCEGLEEKAKVFNGQSAEPSKDMKDVEKRFTTQPKANNHPTVKPQALMKYLITLITPKGGTVLDPFAGSGSTLVAAKDLGFNYIGIELTEEYIPIIEARLSVEKNTLF